MNTSGEQLSEEPQEERGAPGSRDTGSDQPSGGPADRPSGSYEGDESVPTHGGESASTSSDKTEAKPSDTEPAVPPYEGRQTSAKPPGDQTEGQGASTGGAVKPTPDGDFKETSQQSTPGGATASPADEQPAAHAPETQRDDDQVGPGHVGGVGKAEDKK